MTILTKMRSTYLRLYSTSCTSPSAKHVWRNTSRAVAIPQHTRLCPTKTKKHSRSKWLWCAKNVQRCSWSRKLRSRQTLRRNSPSSNVSRLWLHRPMRPTSRTTSLRNCSRSGRTSRLCRQRKPASCGATISSTLSSITTCWSSTQRLASTISRRILR